MELRLRAVLPVLLVMLPVGLSRASDVKKAVSHYEAATAAYAVGDYAEAALEYLEAYKNKPDPALLYDAAQCYRLAHNDEKALLLYKSFLKLYPDHPAVETVRGYVAKLLQPPAAPPQAEPPLPDKPIAPPAPILTPAATPVVTGTRPASPSVAHKPAYRRWWVWTLVGGLAVAGVVAAVVVATWPAPPWGNAPDVGPGRSALSVRW